MKTSLAGRPGHGAHHARLAVLLPVTQQHHLRRERRVAVDGVERRGSVDARFGAVGLHDRVAAVDAHLGVDVDEAVALAFGLERQRREVGLRAQRRRELDAAAAVGEIEIRGQLQAVAVRRDDLVALVADRLLHVVQAQRAALDRSTVGLTDAVSERPASAGPRPAVSGFSRTAHEERCAEHRRKNHSHDARSSHTMMGAMAYPVSIAVEPQLAEPQPADDGVPADPGDSPPDSGRRSRRRLRGPAAAAATSTSFGGETGLLGSSRRACWPSSAGSRS